MGKAIPWVMQQPKILISAYLSPLPPTSRVHAHMVVNTNSIVAQVADSPCEVKIPLPCTYVDHRVIHSSVCHKF